MKLRNDFVSNSSSSSFICLASDASNIELFNTSEILSLHEYLNKFGCSDIFKDWWWNTKHKIKFVSDKEFCSMFKDGITSTLPQSASKEWNALDISSTSQYEKITKSWEKIMPYVEKVLQPYWGNEKFEYYEAEDCQSYNPNGISNDSYDPWENNEESYLYEYFSHHNMGFSRIFSNH